MRSSLPINIHQEARMSDPIPTDDSTDSDAGVIAGVKPDTHLNEMLWIVTVA
ncbi:MAG: hypothetical protein JWL82_108, partial [Parcubacteria group bacterium]|nr:hypothetical protein [Parcubacteria group bacterium]